MSSICFSGSCKNLQYTIIENDDGAFKADIYPNSEETATAVFSDFNTAKIWIKRIINERCKDSDEIGRYN